MIYPINPLAAARYRARYAVSGAKSDATDAVLLANIVRADPGAHRPLPADTELATPNTNCSRSTSAHWYG